MAAIKWSFENISPDLIELDLENNRLTFDHDNIEIDTKVFSFGKKVRSKWLEAIKTTQINFQIRWREFGMSNRRDEQYWIIIEVEEKTPPPTPIEESSLSVEDLKAAGGVMKRKARRRSRDRLPETARNAINEKNKKVGRKTQIPPEIFDKLKEGNKQPFDEWLATQKPVPKEQQQQEPQQQKPQQQQTRTSGPKKKVKAEEDVEMTQSEKDALHERFESILIDPTSLFKWSNKDGKKKLLFTYFTPSLLEKLKVKPNGKIGGYLSWPLTKLAEMFRITLNSPKDKFYSLAEIFLAWSESIDKESPAEQSFRAGVITHERTNVYWGVSPGFPQFVIKKSDSTNIDGTLVVGNSIRFDSYTYDDGGRILPNHISTGIPSLPLREDLPIPLVISCQKKLQQIEEQVRGAIMDEKGDIDLQKLPMSLVGLVNEWHSEPDFIKAMENVSRKLGFKIVFDIKDKESKWPTTYKYIRSWCLAYVDEGPPSGIKPEKGAAYVRSFPIYMPPKATLRNQNFGFCWFHSARGLVHDLALGYLLDDWKKPHHPSNRWLLLGDETGVGKELIKSNVLIRNKNAKKFAYIWVLIPPEIFPTQIASDFHAMDQEYFGREHIRVLNNLVEAPEPRLITFIFETDKYLDDDEKMSDGNISPSATVLKATLPLLFEYISQHTIKNDDFECVISTISEQWGWLETGANPSKGFLNMIGHDYFDHVSARGRGKFRIKGHEIVGKLDHPWLPYADAMGFMTNDSLPKSLENIEKKINDSIKILPIHLSFLNNDFPKLAELLSKKPISFLERLCGLDSKDVYAYMNHIISGMIHHACERFSPIDWVSFNKLMEQEQSRHTGRIIAEQVTNWAVPKLPELLKQLPTDGDRVNMCLTLGWATEQQGGNISPIIEQISPDWLNPETCPERYQLSLVRLIFANRQNFFDFNTDSNLLSESGIFDYPRLTPPDMENILQDKSALTNKNLSILGTFFSSFALQGLKDTSLRESLWKSNEVLAKFEWKHRRDNRRHCIYGGEFAIDCAQHDAKWYEQAHQRLFVDIKYYFATGEGEEEELFWWPAALKYHSLRSDSESHTLEKDECEHLIQKARKIALKSPLPVKIRLFYWMARLSEIYGIPGTETHFQDLKLLVGSHEKIANHDVYAAIFYVHLIDLLGRYNTNAHELEVQSEKLPSKYYKKDGSLDMRYTKCRKFAAKRAGSLKPVDFRRDFSIALENCAETTRLHFSDFLENPDTCITDCLKFNYL